MNFTFRAIKDRFKKQHLENIVPTVLSVNARYRTFSLLAQASRSSHFLHRTTRAATILPMSQQCLFSSRPKLDAVTDSTPPEMTKISANLHAVKLTKEEEDLFEVLTSCAEQIQSENPNSPPLTLRVAGGWVRDKVGLGSLRTCVRPILNSHASYLGKTVTTSILPSIQ